jgi:NAD(P)-dependent dehydrogenase (short-subunit alcohol dehydrogenase family)
VSDGPSAVIVVGGAGSIGAAVVARYLERGVGVVVVDKDSTPIAVTASRDAPLHHLSADVTRDDDVAGLRSSIERLGLDTPHIVSLAGGALESEFDKLVDTDVDSIRESVELNLTSHVLLTRALLPLLGYFSAGRDGGPDRSITLVSSINALRDYGLPAYSAAKAGMFGFVRAMATELGASGIRINAVVPGTVVSGSPQTQPKDLTALRRGSALDRLAVPDDIARVVVAMSHDFTAVTGQFLVVDCGQTVATPAWRLEPRDTKGGSAP